VHRGHVLLIVLLIVQYLGPLSLLKRCLKLSGRDVLSAKIGPHLICVLRLAATYNNDPEVSRLLISEAPHMLAAKDSTSLKPIKYLEQLGLDRSSRAAMFTLMRGCIAAPELEDIFSLIKLCGMSAPLADLLKPQATIWLSLLRHRTNPHVPKSPGRDLAALQHLRPRARHPALHHAVHWVECGGSRE